MLIGSEYIDLGVRIVSTQDQLWSLRSLTMLWELTRNLNSGVYSVADSRMGQAPMQVNLKQGTRKNEWCRICKSVFESYNLLHNLGAH